MRVLSGEENEKALHYLNLSAEIAKKSTCLRSSCGSLIVKNSKIIGSGFNSLPLNKKIIECKKESLPKTFKSDRTCCLHAEQRAIIDALRKNPEELNGSRLYFIRLNGEGEKMPAGEPYCTICSKMALDTGVSEFVLFRNEGACVYNTEEYNDLSFKFR
ncbi:MAG: hypothetical protein M1348_02210 [Candidatus Parvarchaeota archaeon]|nr:hypothetical protein [Candidatus Parvarchaeota archaeon]MCL5101401.1 hypothetical protein [Candidatus Parvarchaeota archaeon]